MVHPCSNRLHHTLNLISTCIMQVLLVGHHRQMLVIMVATTMAEGHIITSLLDLVIGTVLIKLVDFKILRLVTLVSVVILLIQISKLLINSSRFLINHILSSSNHNIVNTHLINQVMDIHQNRIVINQVIIWVIHKEMAV